MNELPELTPELLLRAYAAGVFPMAEHRDDPELFWVDPRRRGVLPLDAMHLSRSLRRRIRSGRYTVSFDTDFPAVVAACAAREETWISPRLAGLYEALFAMGHAHSAEVREAGALVGGVFGVTLGAAFFGESMFSRARDGSKVALAYLVDRLRRGNFLLFDTQFITDHLASLGAIEISRAAYRARLDAALSRHGDWAGAGPVPSAHELLQRSTQTS